jgi:cellulose synthase/poly-beta-1,6-N-acetylglucosamine synthase-like glycosyltransferase
MNLLERSVNGVKVQFPEMSAHRTLSRGQQWTLLILVAVLAAGLMLQTTRTLIVLLALATGLYSLNLLYRLRLFRQALKGFDLVSVSDEEARAIPDRELPVYTVLVPLYHEAEVIGRIVAALEALEYPRDRLDVKLLIEADDSATLEAAEAMSLPLAVPSPSPLRRGLGGGSLGVSSDSPLRLELVRVPVGQPRTKPKACNYGLGLARGDLVTIFDAEDRPEPLQLRRAVAAFDRLEREAPALLPSSPSPMRDSFPPPLRGRVRVEGASVACLQARLSYHNVDQNLLTRWFTVEYAAWFSMMLPALAQLGGPVPLGGTSMHIKRRVLERVGGWDAHNVTEDADLGVRLQRLGYSVAVLDSTTLEEANSDFINWVRQRSRWYKGYLQTWLVHMRQPVRLWRELGPSGFIAMNLMVGAVPLIALINPVFWLLTGLWFLDRSQFIQSLLPAPVYYLGLFCLVIGNSLALYMGLIAIRLTGRPQLLIAALLSPIYWLMMSVAAVRALLQLVIAPSFWEKSVHGLDQELMVKASPNAGS